MGKKEIMSEGRRNLVMGKLSKRRAIIDSQIISVAKGYTNAAFLFGPGGLGKTHLVTGQLDAVCGSNWRHHTSYATPKSLIMTIAEYPESIHVFEDCEKMYKTDVAASILRAACGSPRGRDRWITYETANETYKVNFRGGIIIVSNEDLSRAKGPLAAVASRFRPIKWDLTVEERIASILTIAEEGWRRGTFALDKVQCRRVAAWLVEEMTSGEVNIPVDLRTFTEHALPVYAQFHDDESGPNWKDVLKSKLRGEVRTDEKREDKTKRLEALAMLIDQDETLDTTIKKIEAWQSKTGLGKSIYYRHLKNGTKSAAAFDDRSKPS